MTSLARSNLKTLSRVAQPAKAIAAGVQQQRSIHNPTTASSSFFPKGFALEKFQNYHPEWTESMRDVREAIAKIMENYPDEFWLKCDEEHRFPHELTTDLVAGGWLGIVMPEEFGGSGMGISEASVLLQTISESGGAMAACSSVHMNIFGLEPVVKHGSQKQKERWIPPLIEGKTRACFGVTEPNSGSDTLKLQTTAVKHGDKYVINGRKMWISTAQQAHKILLLARTTPLDQVKKPTHGLSLFYTDFDRTKVETRVIPKCGRNAIDTNLLFFDNWEIPAEDLIGEPGDGFKQIMTGLNAERIFVGAEAIGVGYAALRKGAIYAKERHVFGRPIGMNQSIQHPLARCWMDMEAARLMTYHAARLYDDGIDSGEYANSAKFLGAEAAWKTIEHVMALHGGVGYAKEYHIERYFREIQLPRLTPISPQMIHNYIAQRVLAQPKSY